jgi:hypothetical protein
VTNLEGHDVDDVTPMVDGLQLGIGAGK